MDPNEQQQEPSDADVGMVVIASEHDPDTSDSVMASDTEQCDE